jgi:hypothetical protein
MRGQFLIAAVAGDLAQDIELPERRSQQDMPMPGEVRGARTQLALHEVIAKVRVETIED